MKSILILVVVVVSSLFVQAEDASAGPCRNGGGFGGGFGNGGGFGRQSSFGGGGFGYNVRPSYLSSNRSWGSDCFQGSYRSSHYSSYSSYAPSYYAPAVIYQSAPVVYVQPAPVVIVQVKIWTEAELISVVKQRFEMKYRSELSQISDITIQRVAGSEEYHKSGAMEEVKYLVIWNFTEKSRDGVEKTTMKERKIELEFDTFGRLGN